VAHMGDRSGAYRVLVGRPERNRPVGKSRPGWDDDDDNDNNNNNDNDDDNNNNNNMGL